MRYVILLFLLALLVAKTAAIVVRGPASLERDALQYWNLSTLVLSGDALMLGEPIAYRTPVYPWFLAMVRSCAGRYSLWTLSLIQGCLAVASVLIAGRIASRITKMPRAMLWTLAVSLPAISGLIYCTTVLSETLFVFLLMVHLYAVLDYGKYLSTGRAAWVGATFALALLTRPVVMLLWVPHLFFVAAIQWRRRRQLSGTAGKPNGYRPSRFQPTRRRAQLSHLLIASITVAAGCLPWLFRNDSLFGRPFLTEFVGRNLWVVTFQDGSGAGLPLPDSEATESLQRRLARVQASDDWQATWAVSHALVASGLSDPDADRLMKQVAVDAIESHPDPFLYKALRRTINYWRCAATELPEQGLASGSYFGQVRWRQVVPGVDWAINHRWSASVLGNTLLLGVLALSLLVLLFNHATRPYALWLALILGYFSVVTGALEIPAYRYRMVVEPIVAMTVGSAIAVVLSRRRLEAKLIRSG